MNGWFVVEYAILWQQQQALADELIGVPKAALDVREFWDHNLTSPFTNRMEVHRTYMLRSEPGQ